VIDKGMDTSWGRESAVAGGSTGMIGWHIAAGWQLSEPH